MTTKPSIKLLGPFEATDAAGEVVTLPTRKAEALIAVLALAGHRKQARERLLALLWGDREEEQGRHSLSQALTTIRRVLGGDVLVSDRDTVSIASDMVDIDAHRFLHLIAAGTSDSLREAVYVYRGPLLDGLSLREDDFEKWVAAERLRVSRLAVDAALQLAAAATERNDGETRGWALAKAIAIDPLCEPAHLALVRRLLDGGQWPEAIRHCVQLAETLRDELGTEPGPELLRLWQEAKHQPQTKSQPLLAQALHGEKKPASALAISLRANEPRGADPEEVESGLMAAAIAAAEIVRRRGGHVVRYAADGVLAVFGAPVAVEDHAVRACLAAMAVASRILELGIGGRVQIQLAVDSGRIILRPASESGEKIFGLCIQQAQRLAASAAMASIAVTETTRDLASGRIRFRELGATTLGSGTRPERLFAPEAGRVPLQALPHPDKPFVGRDPELATLRDSLTTAGLGYGQLVCIVGEAGIGKSRLISQLLADGVDVSWRIIAAGAEPHQVDTAYQTIETILRVYFDLPEGSDRETVRARIASVVHELDLAPSTTITPLLSILDGTLGDIAWTALEPNQRRRQFMEAFASLLHGHTQHEPVLLVVEDLHWIDAASRQVLEHLIDTLSTSKIALIVNYRPEFSHPWAGRSFYRQITLHPLPSSQVIGLLEGMLGNDTSVRPLVTALAERAAGNPFFVEECVRATEHAGLLQGSSGRFRFVGDAKTIALPETVQALIAARIDCLDPEAKTVLQIAAVIGADVMHAQLSALSEMPGDKFADAMRQLQSHELLLKHRLLPEIVYRFKHTLTHEVAYGSLLKQRRRELHQSVLEDLERHQGLRPTEQLDVLAYHAWHAEDWARTARYGRQAGMRAASRSANREAISLYQKALSALQYLPETRDRRAAEIDLHIEIRNGLFVLGEPEDITEHLRKAQELARGIGDQPRQSRIGLLLSGSYWQSGEHKRALQIAEEAIALAAAGGGQILMALGHYRRGVNLHALGDYAAAIEDLQRSMLILEQLGSVDLFAFGGHPSVFCASFLTWSLAELGDWKTAREVGEEGWALGQRLNNSYSQAVMSFGWGHSLIRMGDLDAAEAVLDEGLSLFEMSEVPATYPWVASALGYLKVRKGDVDDGLRLIRHSLAPDMRRKGPVYAHPYLWLAEALALAGDNAAALDAAASGRAVAEAQAEAAHLAWAEKLLGDLYSKTDAKEAARRYAAAGALAVRLSLKPLSAALSRLTLQKAKKAPSMTSPKRRARSAGA